MIVTWYPILTQNALETLDQKHAPVNQATSSKERSAKRANTTAIATRQQILTPNALKQPDLKPAPANQATPSKARFAKQANLDTPCTANDDCDTTTNPYSECNGNTWAQPAQPTAIAPRQQILTPNALDLPDLKPAPANQATPSTERLAKQATNADCDTTTNPNSECTGNVGSKTCTCKSGYTKQGTACKASK
ncbi:hypothetical protein DPMN_099315 [Dreissena polymorpha]|uniref:EGF-like domain-containing protein n=1 Tax=Dreissena polymorpha TaxID=45954 RepID=A0A9D4LG84_DREPO|nr:hypothetical protein DPMN_099315 [Dreissena polymorpha]